MRSDAARRLRRLAGSAAVAYIAGTIPTADMASRLATRGSVDVHHEGSGNPGAVNVAKVIGPGWGLGVMAIDIGKGVAACRVAGAMAGTTAAHVAGPAAVIGHCYPVWTRFRGGGKGVATSIGQVLATFPAYFPIDFAVAAAAASVPSVKRRAFVANTAASVTWVAAAALWWRKGLPNLWGPPTSIALPLGAAVSSAVIFVRFATTLGEETST